MQRTVRVVDDKRIQRVFVRYQEPENPGVTRHAEHKIAEVVLTGAQRLAQRRGKKRVPPYRAPSPVSREKAMRHSEKVAVSPPSDSSFNLPGPAAGLREFAPASSIPSGRSLGPLR